MQLQLVLDKVPRLVRLPERHLTRIIAELLHLFERILLDACPDTALGDDVEVNEYFPAQEAVHFFLARGIAQHQAFDCARFVSSEVINVQIREPLHAVEYRIDETLERSSFLGPVKSPPALIDEISVVAGRHYTEEIFTAAFFDEGITFQIEKHVAA